MKASSFYPVILTGRVADTAEFYMMHFGFVKVFEADWYISPLDPQTHFISDGLNELALRIADQPDALDESLSVVRSLLDGWARMPN